MALLELPHLAASSPLKVAISCLLQVSICFMPKVARRGESRSKFVSDGLILDKAMVARQRNCLLIEPSSIRVRTFYPRNLCV